MKQIVIASSILVIAAIGSCGIRHKSDAFACETAADCSDGRSCSGGFCVVPGSVVDAAVGDGPRSDATQPDGAACPSQCTSCNSTKRECTIDCAVSSTGCSGQVVCPAGWHCNIACTTASSCRNGVNCSSSLSCTVGCAGVQSCHNIACGPGPCDVSCSGSQSCDGLACGQSCACDVACADQAACSNVTCSSPQCGTFDGGCSSQSFNCDSCP